MRIFDGAFCSINPDLIAPRVSLELATVGNEHLATASRLTVWDMAAWNVGGVRDGTITCILDWETSGWFPEYWEYTKAHYAPRCDEDWVSQIGSITGEYPEELACENNAHVHIDPIPLDTIQISAWP